MMKKIKKLEEKYKTGFTLVELLAIIVILGVIALTTYPVIGTVIEHGKEKAYNEQVKRIEEAGISYVAEHVSTLLPEGTNSAKVTIATLRSNDLVKKSDIINPKTEKPMNGCVVITKDSYGQYQAKYDDNCVSDEPEEITINVNENVIYGNKIASFTNNLGAADGSGSFYLSAEVEAEALSGDEIRYTSNTNDVNTWKTSYEVFPKLISNNKVQEYIGYGYKKDTSLSTSSIDVYKKVSGGQTHYFAYNPTTKQVVRYTPSINGSSQKFEYGYLCYKKNSTVNSSANVSDTIDIMWNVKSSTNGQANFSANTWYQPNNVKDGSLLVYSSVVEEGPNVGNNGMIMGNVEIQVGANSNIKSPVSSIRTYDNKINNGIGSYSLAFYYNAIQEDNLEEWAINEFFQLTTEWTDRNLSKLSW